MNEEKGLMEIYIDDGEAIIQFPDGLIPDQSTVEYVAQMLRLHQLAYRAVS